VSARASAAERVLRLCVLECSGEADLFALRLRLLSSRAARLRAARGVRWPGDGVRKGFEKHKRSITLPSLRAFPAGPQGHGRDRD